MKIKSVFIEKPKVVIMKNKKIEVLGTLYKIIFINDNEEPRLKENWGFTDFHTKEIFIR